MKIIVAHPGKQHSYRLASALKKKGDLLQYITTLYYKPSSWLIRVTNLFLSKENKKRAQKRINQDLEDNDVTTFCEWAGLIETALVRMGRFKNLYRRFSDWNSNRFGKKVAKYAIRHQADMVICYDSNATACFQYLKKNASSIKRVLDMSIAARPYMKTIYERDMEASKRDDLKIQNLYMWREGGMLPYQQEIEDSDYFLVPSSFVRDSLLFCGVNPKQILIVPYGANVGINVKRDAVISRNYINFLFVGQANCRKGVPYLLEAFDRLDEAKAHLTIVGGYNSNDWFIRKYAHKKNIKCTGYVTFDAMRYLYEQSDVFVFPSLAEGMTLSGIEAMACGLPIICTYNSGVSDIVEDGKSGFIVGTGSVQDITEKMQWFIDHSNDIRDMGERARQTAQKYSWQQYEVNISLALDNCVE